MNQLQITNDPMLERQQPLRLTVPRSVSVVGVGGVGSWVAYFLALAGVREIQLWDHDTVSQSNLNRLPISSGWLDVNKAVAMRDFLSVLSTSEVYAVSELWTVEAQREIGGHPDWIVACTDTWRSRKAVYQWAMEVEGTRYIEASAEGEYGGCTGRPADFATDLEDNPGYASVPVHIGPCVMAASLCCYHILHGVDLGIDQHRIGWSEGRMDL